LITKGPVEDESEIIDDYYDEEDPSKLVVPMSQRESLL
jgi:hypothetical protein